MSTFQENARDGKAPGLKIIDLHGHLGLCRFAIPRTDPESIISTMNTLGIEKFFFSHFTNTVTASTADSQVIHDQMHEIIRRFPKRIYGYISPVPAGREYVKAEMERRLNQGFAGIKLHCNNGFRYNTPEYDECYRIADDLRLIILFHTWGTPADFQEIREIAPKYPHAQIIMAHAGSQDTAGYIQIANDFKNVYLDTAFSRAPYGLVKQLVEGVGAEKVIWGSDCNYFGQTHQIGKVLGAHISEEAKCLILRGNAERLLAESKLKLLS